jgi:uncharacterized glyoxalase superfamily protein PhnB
MVEHKPVSLSSAIFITFSGNCKKALTFYQTCFGGRLQFETFEQELTGYKELPVVTGSLVSDKIVIHGSDLVHNTGRKVGNNMAIFFHCVSIYDRNNLICKLAFDEGSSSLKADDNLALIEVIDAFDVRWVLGV